MGFICYCQVQMGERNSYHFEWRWFRGFSSNVFVPELESESDIITETNRDTKKPE